MRKRIGLSVTRPISARTISETPSDGYTVERLVLDLNGLEPVPAVFVRPAGVHDRWQDHGMGVLRTILQQHGVENDMISLRSMRSWGDLQKGFKGYDMLIMNVRSYTFPLAYKAAQVFKQVNPKGLVITGGMHATVAPDEMEAIQEFDRICQGPGEGIIVDLVKDPLAFPRLVQGVGVHVIRAHLVDNRAHDALAAGVGDQCPFPVAPLYPAL